jgi:prophage tail gpP-like protein
MPELELRVNGEAFRGWTSVSVTRSIEQICNQFQLTFTERWSERDEAVPIREGYACEVFYQGKRLISGYVDGSQVSYSAESHQMSVSGRSAAGDLVDCSAIVSGGQFRSQTFESIAASVVAPFGLEVISEVDTGGQFRRFAVQDGETCHELLERMARSRGVLLVSDDQGRLIITAAGSTKSGNRLERGVNILSGQRTGSWSDRFSLYTVKSQNSGGDDWNGRQATQVYADSTDATVDRYRPIVILAEAQLQEADAKTRADWERNIRAGRAQRLTYTVQGWDDPILGVWTPNSLVKVKDDFFGVDDELLVVTARLTHGDRGQLAELDLARPEAYDGLAEPPTARPGGGFW